MHACMILWSAKSHQNTAIAADSLRPTQPKGREQLAPQARRRPPAAHDTVGAQRCAPPFQASNARVRPWRSCDRMEDPVSRRRRGRMVYPASRRGREACARLPCLRVQLEHEDAADVPRGDKQRRSRGDVAVLVLLHVPKVPAAPIFSMWSCVVLICKSLEKRRLDEAVGAVVERDPTIAVVVLPLHEPLVAFASQGLICS